MNILSFLLNTLILATTQYAFAQTDGLAIDPTASIRFERGVDMGAYQTELGPKAIVDASSKSLILILVNLNKENGYLYSSQDYSSALTSPQTVTMVEQTSSGIPILNFFGIYRLIQQQVFKSLCRRVADETNYFCPSMPDVVSCSAFATNNGKSLWTANHCFSNVRELIRVALSDPEKVSGIPIAYIFDNKGKLVSGPLGLNEMGLLQNNRLYDYSPGLSEIKNDYIQISLKTPVSLFFEIGAVKTDGVIFNLGNPHATGAAAEIHTEWDRASKFARPMGLDAADGFLRYSKGVAISNSEFLKILTLTANDSTSLAILGSDPDILLTTADGMRGFSGGPMINEQGQVVGLFSSLNCVKLKVGTNSRCHTIGVRPREWSRF